MLLIIGRDCFGACAGVRTVNAAGCVSLLKNVK